MNTVSLAMGAYGVKQFAKSGISYVKANEPYIKAISSNFKEDVSIFSQDIKNNNASILKNSIRKSNKNFMKTTFGSNGGNVEKWVSDTASNVKEDIDSIKNLKPGVKVTNQSESSSSGEIEDLIKVSKDGSNSKLDAAINNGQPMNNHKIVTDAEASSLPATKQPANSSADLLNSDGSVKQRRYYDADGKAKMDIDFNHTDDGTHEFPHIHIWDWTKKPPRQDSRR